MAKRAVKKPARADDKRATGTARNPKKVAAPEAKKTSAPSVPTFKKSTAGGGAGRPKRVK